MMRPLLIAAATTLAVAGSSYVSATTVPPSPTTESTTEVATASTVPSETTAAAAEGESAVQIPVGDHEVPGILALPGGTDGEVPAVLMLHGFGSQKNEVGDMYAREAAALAERGVASLRIDFAGTGDSAQPYTDNTFDGMVADAAGAYEWLVSQSETADDAVGVLGFSMGSKVALGLVAETPDVPALASWSGALSDGLPGGEGLEDLWEQAKADGHVVNDLGFIQLDLSEAWFESMDASTPKSDALGYAGAVLAIAGADDDTVDPQVSQDFLAAVNTPDESLRIIAGADHIFHVLGDDQALADEVITLTADWFADRFGVAQSPTLSDITIPEITMPDITVPDITIPDITMSDLTLPDLTLPDLTLPDVTLPDLTLPDLTLPATETTA